MDKKEDEKLFGHLLAYNRYFVLMVALNFPFAVMRMIDSLAMRCWLILLVWVAIFAVVFAAQVRMMKKFFLPKYQCTGIFSVKQYFTMIFVHFLMCIYFPISVGYDSNIEMMEYFRSLIHSH
jgi:hypothetical protein